MRSEFLPRLMHVVEQKNALITKVYGGEPDFSGEAAGESAASGASSLLPYIRPTEVDSP